ncbi:grpE protein homolog 1, mitochondrial isoform X1 [Eptesicus fuscus]|uniref:grpE protein homolog 1, mitochondrial isoform X1 n=1 Tax=Eptesicus fuscus TaxID=29078 RepID=UPI0024040AA5|nr:grpE protein homolog 1, mitochondrial isoform X1 [Eptesicus fuscus]
MLHEAVVFGWRVLHCCRLWEPLHVPAHAAPTAFLSSVLGRKWNVAPPQMGPSGPGEEMPTPRLLCTAAKQKNSGQNLEEDVGQTDQKTDTPCAEKTLMEEKAKLEEQLKDTTEKYKRALADTENLRQRTQKLVEEAKLYGIQGFCKDLLEVADILEKATQSVPKEEVTEDNPHLKSLYEGLVMTEVQIQKVFTKHGLLRLDPVGAKFDPYEHEALFHTPVEGKEPGTVALVNKVGYKLHGRTLRPALVGVVKEA